MCVSEVYTNSASRTKETKISSAQPTHTQKGIKNSF